uniref:Putative cellular senescence inhibited gene protein n=1 Tax=Schistosoma japonicum TaxID=6182 RepID=C1LL05_SCHJA|nr:putative cellular senescence inhibited gene protein [Schistosoma japonicum]CAX75382.1 putative cellular senescence inhibited gene protein [Schistosoma japonicum]CAX75383.1 putative cellular senescence inhibited gene protein [Schistosoma japonicum]
MDIIKANLNNITDTTFKEPESKPKTLSLIPNNIHLVVVSKISIPKIIRVKLLHRAKDLSVCLIVKDLRKDDHERTTESWKRRWVIDLKKSKLSHLDTPGVTFLPLHELKVAYQTFAAKRRLAATFDIFLADKRIVHRLQNKLGKAFYQEISGKFPIPTSFSKNNLADTVKKQINTSLFVIRGNGTTDSLIVGNELFSSSEIKENVISVCEKICLEWPGGGLANIRSVYIQSPNISIPLYYDETEASLTTISEKLSTLPKSVYRKSHKLVKKLEYMENGIPMISQPKISRKPLKRLTKELVSQIANDVPLTSDEIDKILRKRRSGNSNILQAKLKQSKRISRRKFTKI